MSNIDSDPEVVFDESTNDLNSDPEAVFYSQVIDKQPIDFLGLSAVYAQQICDKLKEIEKLKTRIMQLEAESSATKCYHNAENIRLMNAVKLLESNSKNIIENNKREYATETKRLSAIINDLQQSNNQLNAQCAFYEQSTRVKFSRFYDDMIKVVRELAIGARITCLGVITTNFRAAGLNIASLDSPKLQTDINIWLNNYLRNNTFDDKGVLYTKYFN